MQQNAATSPALAERRRTHRVLVVNHQRHIARLFQVNLERARYEVLIALDGRGALDIIAAEHVDLVILDADMPPPDGFAVLEDINALPIRNSIHVMMLVRSEWEGQKATDAGSNSYLVYPFNPFTLLDFLRRR